MSLLDTIDGSFMNVAYGWAFAKPVRKIYYNLTVTSLSVAVALVIGVVELVSVLSERFGIHSGPLAWVGSVNLSDAGFWIVGLFVVTWLVSIAIWRWGRIEERWSPALTDSSAAGSAG
jgi:high-affinity nickel-transport protein